MKQLCSRKLIVYVFAILLLSSTGFAGSIFVTGHDPVWHSEFGDNAAGAINLASTAIEFARNGSLLPFLFVESTTAPVPGGNAFEAPFLSHLGYTAADYDVADIGV